MVGFSIVVGCLWCEGSPKLGHVVGLWAGETCVFGESRNLAPPWA